jgi:hypothetical protein
MDHNPLGGSRFMISSSPCLLPRAGCLLFNSSDRKLYRILEEDISEEKL